MMQNLLQQRLLILSSILILVSFSSYADNSTPPGLPPLPSNNKIENTTKDEDSFFSKMKNFIGFSNKPAENNHQIEETESSTNPYTELNREDTKLDDLDKQEDFQETKDSTIDIDSKDINLSSSNDETGTDPVEDTTPSPADTTKLKLPFSFEEYIKSDSSIEEEEVQDNKESLAEEDTDIKLPTKSLELQKDLELQDEDIKTEVQDNKESPAEEDTDIKLPTKSLELQQDVDIKTNILVNPQELDKPVLVDENDITKNDNHSEKEKDAADNIVTTNIESNSLSDQTSNDDDIINATKATEQVTQEKTDIKKDITEATPLPEAINASDIKDFKQAETKISKYQKELKSKPASLNNISKITKDDFIKKDADKKHVVFVELDPKQIEFVKNESQVLTLPNDDIVLGELTKEAKLELIDFREYTQIFWKEYETIKNSKKRLEIEKFIANYDKNYKQNNFIYNKKAMSAKLGEAFQAIRKDDITTLIALLNNYPILRLTTSEHNNLLHWSAYLGNYSAARLLVLKGIYLNEYNINKQTALIVSEKFGNEHITYLLKNASRKNP